MKIVIQRVLRGAATVNGETVGSIQKGMVVLIGIDREDTQDDMDYIVRKILTIRIWPNEEERPWRLNIKNINGSILMASQFTLMHKSKGTKPDFHRAMAPEGALEMFNRICDKLRAEYDPEKIATGKFQSYSSIDIVNDGPVTFIVDSKNRE
ncbi:unnamed protein product [Phytomonas sp. Hart1]|nr:unnamed protein product [Phytomonas sp. Hart1]|eukprot:CCW66900.1 unnamed protein product [Phytomonas sp. isolate Hart1]